MPATMDPMFRPDTVVPSRTVRTVSAPAWPTSARIWFRSCARTDASLQTRPAAATTIRTSGDSDSKV